MNRFLSDLLRIVLAILLSQAIVVAEPQLSDRAQSCYLKGNLLSDKGLLQDACREYSRAIHFRDDFGLAWDARARVYCLLGDFMSAKRDSLQALCRSPKDRRTVSRFWYTRACALSGLGEAGPAASALRQSLAQDPNNKEAKLLMEQMNKPAAQPSR